MTRSQNWEITVLTLALIGLIGGLVTGISPCILPVLPVIFFTGAQATRGAAAGATTPHPPLWRDRTVVRSRSPNGPPSRRCRGHGRTW